MPKTLIPEAERQPAITYEIAKSIAKMHLKGTPISSACIRHGVSYRSLCRARNKDKKIANLLTRAKNFRIAQSDSERADIIARNNDLAHDALHNLLLTYELDTKITAKDLMAIINGYDKLGKADTEVNINVPAIQVNFNKSNVREREARLIEQREIVTHEHEQ